MQSSLCSTEYDTLLAKLSPAAIRLDRPARPQPVHTMYGGAQLFKAESTQKLAALAQKSFSQYAPAPLTLQTVFGLSTPIAQQVFELVQQKLATTAIEDYRIDFEDGYGVRSNEAEDQHAIQAANEMQRAVLGNQLPPSIGIRIKALTPASTRRALRTLDLFLTAYRAKAQCELPQNFVITIPKVSAASQVRALVAACELLEAKLGLSQSSLALELMIETPSAVLSETGTCPIPNLIAAAQGRCRGIHFGAFDYTASLGISAQDQELKHPACDFARQAMLLATAETGIWLADGVTTILPLEPHRATMPLTPAQQVENNAAIHRAWKIHFDNIRHSLRSGFYQSWDLHPAQLIPRYVATYSFFRENLTASATRLQNFVQKAAQATTVGEVFDDAASGQGLLNFFARAIGCGALTENELLMYTGLTIQQINSGSFEQII